MVSFSSASTVKSPAKSTAPQNFLSNPVFYGLHITFPFVLYSHSKSISKQLDRLFEEMNQNVYYFSLLDQKCTFDSKKQAYEFYASQALNFYEKLTFLCEKTFQTKMSSFKPPECQNILKVANNWIKAFRNSPPIYGDSSNFSNFSSFSDFFSFNKLKDLGKSKQSIISVCIDILKAITEVPNQLLDDKITDYKIIDANLDNFLELTAIFVDIPCSLRDLSGLSLDEKNIIYLCAHNYVTEFHSLIYKVISKRQSLLTESVSTFPIRPIGKIISLDQIEIFQSCLQSQIVPLHECSQVFFNRNFAQMDHLDHSQLSLQMLTIIREYIYYFKRCNIERNFAFVAIRLLLGYYNCREDQSQDLASKKLSSQILAYKSLYSGQRIPNSQSQYFMFYLGYFYACDPYFEIFDLLLSRVFTSPAELALANRFKFEFQSQIFQKELILLKSFPKGLVSTIDSGFFEYGGYKLKLNSNPRFKSIYNHYKTFKLASWECTFKQGWPLVPIVMEKDVAFGSPSEPAPSEVAKLLKYQVYSLAGTIDFDGPIPSCVYEMISSHKALCVLALLVHSISKAEYFYLQKLHRILLDFPLANTL